MMQAFRSSAKVIGVVFAVLMLLFMLTSVDWSALGTSTTVGEINGQSVEVRQYEAAVQAQIDAVQRQAPRALGLEDVQRIRDDVWEQFIQNSVLEAEYAERGITVADDEVVQYIRNVPPQEIQQLPDFQTDGKFDLGKYQRWLTSSIGQQYIPVLEAQAREQIRRAKLLSVVTADVFLSDAALWERYRDREEKVTVGLTPIIPRNAVPDSAVKLTDAEVQAYYRSHQKELERPKTAFLSFVTLPRVTNAADSAAALERARAVREEIVGGAPFAEVARRESADSVSALDGGDLGKFARGQMVSAFDSAVFALPLNTVSEPVLSDFGYHILEVTSRKADTATARHVLIPIELAGAHRDSLDAKADTLDQLAAEQTDRAALDTVAQALNLRIGRTAPVQQGSRVQIGRVVVPDAGVWAFQSEPGDHSPIIETSDAFWVFRLDSLREGGVPPLASIRADVEELARRDKKWEAARDVAKAYVQRLEQGASMADAAQAMGLPHDQFGPFTRIQPPLPNPTLVGAAFRLPEGQRSGVLETPDGLYVLEVRDRIPADSAEFRKQLEELRLLGIQAARRERVQNYLTALRQEAEVVDRREEAYRNAQAQAEAQAQLPSPLGL